MIDINFVEFSKKSDSFEKNLDNGYKKRQGVFYTDVNLSYKLIEFLNLDKTKKFYEPNCGSGSFVYAAKRYGFEEIYAADIDKNMVSLSRKLTGLKASQIKTIDTIGNHTDEILKKFKVKEKFDYIIGNPPYVPINQESPINSEDYFFLRNVKDSGNNLFIASLYKALEIVKTKGLISFIIPKNFLHVASYSLLRKKLLRENTIHSIIDLGKCFKGVRGEQIVFSVIKSSPKTNNRIKFCRLEDDNEIVLLSEIEQNVYSNEILFFDSNESFELYKKLNKSYQSFGDIYSGYVGRGRSKEEDAISGKEIRKFGFKSRRSPQKGNQLFIQNIYSAEAGIIAAFAGDLQASETVTVITDGDEKMCRYILGILHTRLCNYYLVKFCFNNSKLTMHTDAKYLKKIPLVREKKTFNQVVNIVKQLEKVEYMSDVWFDFLEDLNSLVYKIYNISNAEASYINGEMKKIQSEKWNANK
ncbi:HsdM family class I SAM-dependent methyltransferase [Streptococcus rifensis]